jgi:hypothetical protein
MPSRKVLIRLLLCLLVVGVVAAIVYGLCGLAVLQAGTSGPDPASGHVFFYQSIGRGGRVTPYYVTRTFHLTSMISGIIAAICLGPPLIAGLGFLFGDTARLLIPARHERANLELARYRKAVGADGITEEGLRYVAAWRDLNRRSSLLFCLFVILIVPAMIHLPQPWGMVAMLAWAAGVVILGLWYRAFRCPRCGERFSGKKRTRLAPPFCASCGLPRDSCSTEAVSPDFDAWKQMNARAAASATSRYRVRRRR